MLFRKVFSSQTAIATLGLVALAAWNVHANDGDGRPSRRSSATVAGPGSSAGGNSIAGKMIESYYHNVSQLDGYEKVIAPMIHVLATKLPKFAHAFSNKANDLDWYLIPAAVKERSEEITGLPFPSDQIAVQGSGEVWIDETLFRAQDTLENAKLLIHETSLGMIVITTRDPEQIALSMPGIMKVARKMTRYLIENHEKATPEALRDGLTHIFIQLPPHTWIDRALLLKTPKEIEEDKRREEEKKKEEEREAEEKRKSAEKLEKERRAALPTLQPMAYEIVNQMERFCKKWSEILNNNDWEHEIGFITKSRILHHLKSMSKAVYPNAIRAGAVSWEADELDDLGLRHKDVKSFPQGLRTAYDEMQKILFEKIDYRLYLESHFMRIKEFSFFNDRHKLADRYASLLNEKCLQLPALKIKLEEYLHPAP